MTDTIDSIAAELGFDPEDTDLSECLTAAQRLGDIADDVSQGTTAAVDSIGVALEDDYGALLDGFDDPRIRDEADENPLSGHRVAVKDNVAVDGLAMTCGSDAFEYVPAFDALVVNRLLEAGAKLVGKANMDAFAFGPSGEFSNRRAVTNPLDESRVPGGSSSGSGVAVATDAVDAALGTDTGGSVRIPAACCGLVGIKPTYGTVPNHGVVPFAPSLDTVGPLARDVETAGTVLDAIRNSDGGTQSDPDKMLGDEETITAGLVTTFVDNCTDTVSASTDVLCQAADAETSVSVQEVSIDTGSIEDAYLLIGSTEFAWYIKQRGLVRGCGSTYTRRWSKALSEFVESDGFSNHVAKRVLPSAYLDEMTDGHSYLAGRIEAQSFDRRLEQVFESVDVLLVPTIRSIPPKRGEVTAHEKVFDLLGNTAPFNLTGHPAVTLPIDSYDGLPVSLQVVAPKYADDLALECASTLERAVDDADSLEPPVLPAS